MRALRLCFLVFFAQSVHSLVYEQALARWNLNQNQQAINPLDYSGEYPNHQYQKSPENWRFPFYTIFPDRFVNGDPNNDNANGTQFEHDIMGTQLRNGGDVRGIMDSFDYLQGMGIKGLYIVGMPHINLPWAYDGFSPTDLTLLDFHHGDIEDWRAMINEAHRRGMYVMLENTIATMSDLIGFDGYLNESTPFDAHEHDFVWKDEPRYHDFAPGNNWLEKCDYPRFWDPLGKLQTNLSSLLVGCRDSDFNQYGEVAAFGDYPEWMKQVTKFAFVQDRLREWKPSVLAKIEHFSCLTIKMLDIDGFRVDKGLQVTIDSLGHWSEAMRKCARDVGKTNFFIPGEIVGGNTLSSVYIGRGKEPQMAVRNLTEAVGLTKDTAADDLFIREHGKQALDSAAFHYTIYRALTRFLGLDGTYAAEGDPPVNFVETWNELVSTNDMINAETGRFDPRHMFGVTNFDVFRWPAIRNGTELQNLGMYIVTLMLPGIPLVNWGEEQAFYILENTNANYVFGRQPMSSSVAWQLHGCYKVGSVKYANFPIDAAAYGCMDENVALDHRDPSHPVRNIIKHMNELRQSYSVLNDGFYLQQLSNQTREVFLPGSNNTPTETGLWSVYRSAFFPWQNLTDAVNMWFVYQNDGVDKGYSFDCGSNENALISPFDSGTTVKNLFPPFDEYVLEASGRKLGINASPEFNGCLQKLAMPAWGYKLFVPKEDWIEPAPAITKFFPGHDFRLFSNTKSGGRVPIEIHFSQAMDCESLKAGVRVNSHTGDNTVARIDLESVQCMPFTDLKPQKWVGALQTAWKFEANIINLSHGIHEIVVDNVTSVNGRATGSVDHFLLRVGNLQNPMVFRAPSNYSSDALFRRNNDLVVKHSAPGAEKWSYSLDWSASWSDWLDYDGKEATVRRPDWSGTDRQKWEGEHIIIQYWSKLTGSSNHYVHSDIDFSGSSRHLPHVFVSGSWNDFGLDSGLRNQMTQERTTGTWNFDFMQEWPQQISLNTWGINPDGQPDRTQVFGDIDGDGILDRLPLKTLLGSFVNVTDVPPSPHMAWRISLYDSELRYELIPVGSRWIQLMLFILFLTIPVFSGSLAVYSYRLGYSNIKFNQVGAASMPTWWKPVIEKMKQTYWTSAISGLNGKGYERALQDLREQPHTSNLNTWSKRRTILIATMEYDIEDWAVKIKIGGLGVMAQLMGKHLTHQNLIWVVPCVGGVDYPRDTPAEPMGVSIMGKNYTVDVQYHILHNITYVLLDAPVFRKQSKSEPYPARMDDLESAVYYSAWNQCIAQVMDRFPIDLYHINDYHGALAPLYLLPDTIPCCLSLHNAEFQGLWSMKSKKEKEEACSVYNLTTKVVEEYVQFGDVFNLLHAGASYLRIFQKGYGTVGVSKKYGKRSYARYPIFWGLKEIQALPNPDPSDTGEWNPDAALEKAVIDPTFEAGRAELKRQAQEWAGLDQDPNAQLFVFVGRWSMQKGVDLIADVFPRILEETPNAQLICVGPVIDLYGSFAAAKLEVMMRKYPGRVFSRPEFTALPPYIFSGAEFALIPSRDEPFGLVAVEFGRKGALGIGARVGGLGQMPGWWYTVESTTTKNLLAQFSACIKAALKTDYQTRAMMRARSAKQRFPVKQWVLDLGQLQQTCINVHEKYAHQHRQKKRLTPLSLHGTAKPPVTSTRIMAPPNPHLSPRPSRSPSPVSRISPPGTPGSPQRKIALQRSVSSRLGPGHQRLHPYGDGSRPVTNWSWCEETVPEGSEAEDEHLATRSRVASPFPFESPASTPVPRAYELSPEELAHYLQIELDGAHAEQITTGNDSAVGGRVSPEPGAYFPRLAMDEIARNKQEDMLLENVEPFFNDPKAEYIENFKHSLKDLSAANSEKALCIEAFLEKSEKDWFGRYRRAKLGKFNRQSHESSVFRFGGFSGRHTPDISTPSERAQQGPDPHDLEQFLLAEDYKPPFGIEAFLQHRIGDWPLYSLFIAFGQIISANSYQVTLLAGEIGLSAQKIYVIASIYLVGSIGWWVVFRRFKSVFVLSVPFVIYGLAFLLLGLTPYVPSTGGRGWVQNVATGLYAFASASGSIFFALNFGDDGGAPISAWVFRACVIQGMQQAYVVVLWYWGTQISKLNSAGSKRLSLLQINPGVLTGVAILIAVFMWTVGWCLFAGLPKYYRQAPGQVPAFYKSLLRRKIIAWFFYYVLIQNYWLSAPYGRSWLYLWSSQHLAVWQIVIMVIVFFGLLWGLILFFLGKASERHSWLLPIFAIGLGAPRWCQILWSTSNIGLYVPWAGDHVASAVAGRLLWLWLGLLDLVQGVGYGIILLTTLTRFHIAFTLIAGQVLGSLATILGRATAPDRVGPGDVFPDFSSNVLGGLSQHWFWICLLLQLSTNVWCLMFFRKEQLAKP